MDDLSLSSDVCDSCQEVTLPLQPSCPACAASMDWELVCPCPGCGESVDHLEGYCSACDEPLGPWTAIRQAVRASETDIVVAKNGLPSPPAAGFRPHIGSLKGQRRDYRHPLEDGSDVHVREYDDRYEVHHDEVSAVEHPVGHLFTHAPHYLVGAVGVTALAIARSSRSRSALELAGSKLGESVSRPSVRPPRAGVTDRLRLGFRPFR